MKLVTSVQMQAVDREAIDGRGIPGPELMENAGGGIAAAILEDLIPKASDTKIAVVCGKGNNGGDGYVIARYLQGVGCEVEVYHLGPVDKFSDDAKLNYDRAAELDLPLHEVASTDDLPDDADCDIIVDAIFGTGFSGAPRGFSAELIEWINRQDADIVAVDMPSGLNADNGQAEGAVVMADFTYTLALAKYGLFVSPGRECAGDVEVIPIGVPDDVIASFDFTHTLITADLVADLLPVRPPDGHKGTFGYVLCVAGSTGLTGAAALAAESALRSGCGLVKLAAPASVLPVLATLVREATGHPLPDVAKKGVLALRGLGEIRKLAKEHHALMIGPGIGRHHETQELVRRLVSTLDKPTVIDADGLNAFEGHTDLLKDCAAPLVLTPHPGEFNRLTGQKPSEDIHERIDDAVSFAKEFKVVLVLKGSPTLVASPDGLCFVNPTGNNGMATGGSGDVLTGIIGSFLAQGMEPLDAAVAGVFIHGQAGDFAAEDFTPRAVIAGDLLFALSQVFDGLE